MKKKFLIVSLILLSSMALQAQHYTLTIDSCRALALQNQAKMQVAQLENEVAQQTKMEALTKYFPQISATAGWFHSQDYMLNVNTTDVQESGALLEINANVRGTGVNSSELPIQQVLDYLDVSVEASLKMLDHGTFANAMLLQPVFMGGRIYNGNKLARLGVEASQLQMQMTTNEVLLNVEELYWMVWTLQVKQQALQQAMAMVDTLRRDAEAATNAGIIGKNDLLKVKLKQQELLATQTQLRNGIQLATMALLQYVGLPFGDAIELTLEKPSEINVPVLASNEELLPNGRTEAQLLELNVKAKELERKMSIGEALPQVAVGLTYGYNNILSNRFSGNGLVFATAQVPLSAWWETMHTARKKRVQHQIAQINSQDLVQKLQLQNQQIYNEMTQAYDLVRNKQQAVSDAKENLAEVKNYYDAGMVGVSDYLEAQTLLQQAQTDLADQQMIYLVSTLRWQQVKNK